MDIGLLFTLPVYYKRNNFHSGMYNNYLQALLHWENVVHERHTVCYFCYTTLPVDLVWHLTITYSQFVVTSY